MITPPEKDTVCLVITHSGEWFEGWYIGRFRDRWVFRQPYFRVFSEKAPRVIREEAIESCIPVMKLTSTTTESDYHVALKDVLT